ncbi:uncharacterized protein LOC115627775 [Scaptodrosophila lebanonensis]|uniref:Uncharacterized protein LOC115627775 n=1 Tax=Drosophila lebanonensis TaxID=7225 RepID=A0A6J2TS30_DROLE|nr:uncharacterized protein LOC115627775 [Scaptodrosophila lebanonensis]XP_030379442.1 uncharacterized protein LOC115627775 [Scaptodrosophila lebanonensis]
MASSSQSKKNKSSGLRILWIPGGRKSHPKGRFSTTNKHISYSPNQKKSEVWTLGGSKSQSGLIDAQSPEASVASTSSLTVLAPISCTLSISSEKLVESSDANALTAGNSPAVSECATLPVTPISATPTQLAGPFTDQQASGMTTVNISANEALSKNLTSPLVVTTVEILDLHNHLHPHDLPKVPSFADLSTSPVVLNSSAGTTASIETNSSPHGNRKSGTQTTSPQASPQKGRYRNHNNNHEDINSIESISSINKNILNDDFEWIDVMMQERTCEELKHKNKRKKTKKALQNKEADQLDGKQLNCNDAKSKADSDDGDDKVVKCLYYSLMCCDCTIS